MSGKQCQSVSPGLKGREKFDRNDTKCAVQNMEGSRVFPRPFRHGGVLSPHMGGQSFNGGTLEGDIDIMGGPNFDRLYSEYIPQVYRAQVCQKTQVSQGNSFSNKLITGNAPVRSRYET